MADSGSTGLARLAKAGPTVVFNLLQQLDALGLNLPAILEQLGVSKKNGGAEVASAPPPAEAEPPSRTPRADRNLAGNRVCGNGRFTSSFVRALQI
jgi:hypothetical protein